MNTDQPTDGPSVTEVEAAINPEGEGPPTNEESPDATPVTDHPPPTEQTESSTADDSANSSDEGADQPAPEGKPSSSDASSSQQYMYAEHLEAGRDINLSIANAYAEESRLSSVGGDTIDRVEEVFVAPPAFQKRSERNFGAIHKHRIAIVEGGKGSGRLTTALALASRLLTRDKKSDIYRCERKDRKDDLTSLVTLALEKKASVLIVEKIFQRGITEDELISPLVDGLIAKLRHNNAFLILTAERKIGGGRRLVPRISTAQLDLEQVFEKTVEVNASEMIDTFSSQLESWSAYSKALTKPAYIHRFINSLQDIRRVPDSKGGKEALLRRMAKEAASPGTDALDRWFDRLELQDRLWAFLIAFFDGAPLPQLIQLNAAVAHHLRRNDSREIRNPTAQQVSPLLRRLHVRSLGEHLEWEEDIYPQFVLGGPVMHHQVLLWETASALLDNLNLLLSFRNPALRVGLGRLLGALARTYPAGVTAELNKLAKGGLDRQIIASYAVRGLVEYEGGDAVSAYGDDDLEIEEEVDDRSFEKTANQALRVMFNWGRSKNHRQRWTAAAASWQAFDVLSRQKAGTIGAISRLLHRAAKEPKGRTWSDQEEKSDKREYQGMLWAARGSVSFALARVLGRTEDLPSWLEHIVIWWLHDDPRSDYPQIVLRGIGRYVEETGAEHPKSVSTLCALLSVIVRVATPKDNYRARQFPPLFQQIFSHIGHRWMSTPEGRANLSEASRMLSTGLPRELRGRWVEHTAHYWVQGAERELSRKIWARATTMEGYGVYPPPDEAGTALLVIDPALLFQQDRSASNLKIRQLAAELSRRWVLRTAPLGRGIFYDSVEEFLETEQSLQGYQKAMHPHCLAAPCLDALDQAPKLAVLVAHESVLDLDDFKALVGRVILVSLHRAGADTEAESEGSIARAEFHPLKEPEDFENWRDRIDRIASEGASMATTFAWRPFLIRLGITNLSADAVWNDVRRLEDDWLFPEESAGEELRTDVSTIEADAADSLQLDVIHQGCGVIGWLAADDLADCCHRLAQWLSALPPIDNLWIESGSEQKQNCGRWVALAGARFLFRLHRQNSIGNWPGLKELFDQVAPALCIADPVDGPSTVLKSVESWLFDPDWVAFLSGDIQDGRGRLIRWAEQYLPDSAAALAPRLQPPPLPEAKTLWNEASFLTSGRRLSIPAIDSNRRYGLIVTAPGFGTKEEKDQVSVLLEDLANDVEVEPLLFKVGRSSPIWIRGETRVWSTGDYRHAPLLLPLLEQPQFSTTRVAFILILGGGELLDAAELAQSRWWPHLVRFHQESLRDGLRWLAHGSDDTTRKDNSKGVEQKPKEPKERDMVILWQEAIREISEKTSLPTDNHPGAGRKRSCRREESL